MNFKITENKGERIWGASKHSISQFIERNRFLTDNDYREALFTLLNMMEKATFVCFDLKQNSDVYTYGSWVFICKESTIVTVYTKKRFSLETSY